MTEESVLKKVQKLIALAGNNPNQHEAETAMMRAQELLAKNGLTMAQAEAAGGKRQEASQRYVKNPTTTVTWWQKDIAAVVAKNFRCFFYIQIGGTTRMVFIGLPVDIEVCQEIYTLAVETAKREAARFIRQEKSKAGWDWSRSKSNALRNDYLRGWRVGLKVSFQKNAETSALVVVIPEQVKEKVEKMSFRSTSASRTTTAGSRAARESGRRDGSNFNRTGRIAS